MKGKIGLVILVITLALTGLIAIQIYWIGQAAEFSKDQFNRNVSFALKDVSRRMETREASGYIEKKVNVNTDRGPSKTAVSTPVGQKIKYAPTKKLVLGVNVRNIDEALIRKKDLVSSYGIYVESVYKGFPAEAAGIKRGDIITQVDGEEVNSPTELIMALEGLEKGDDLNLTFERPAERVDIARDFQEYPQVEGLPFYLAKHDFVNMLIDSFANAQRITINDQAGENLSYVATFPNRMESIRGFPDFFYNTAGARSVSRTVFTIDSTGSTTTEISKLEDDKSLFLAVNINSEDFDSDRKMSSSQMNNTVGFMEELVKNFMNQGISPSERLKNFDIDDLLREELKGQSIRIEPQWTVVNSNNTPIACSDVFAPDGSDEVFQTPLFTHLDKSEPSYLKVYFPEQKTYLRQAQAFIPFIAFLFTLAIIACFWYAIRTLFNQKKISDMKTDFINNMTHELKTPVATIKLASEMMLEKSGTTGTANDRYLNIIQDENTRLSKQIERVLEIAKYEKGNLNLDIQELNIHEVLEEALSKSSSLIEMKEGEIMRSFLEGPATVYADRQHLINVFHNLIDNAIKYTQQNPVINISTTRQDGEILVRVQDNGIGMSKEEQKKIFDKFYRVSTGNLHDNKGFGLGLSYVKLMMDAHGGKIQVKSKPNQGSLFELFFPKENHSVQLN